MRHQRGRQHQRQQRIVAGANAACQNALMWCITGDETNVKRRSHPQHLTGAARQWMSIPVSTFISFYMPLSDDAPAMICALCQRQVPPRLITLHHLKPKQKGGTAAHRTPLCRPCHKQLHATFSNNDLARLYDTIDGLRAAPLLQPFLKWIRKQKPDRNFRTTPSSAHPDSRRRKKRP
jgi:5-methylcytosine-specific restriction protein A